LELIEFIREHKLWIESISGTTVALIFVFGFSLSMWLTSLLLHKIRCCRESAINVAILLFSALFSFFVAEWIYRYTIDQTDWLGGGMTHRWFLRHETNNSLGFRDEEHSLGKPENTFRIAFLGDGFIHGYGIRDITHLFPKRIETSLREQGIAVEALLFGKAGAGPTWMRNIIEEYAEPMGFDFVIYTHYMNDIEEVTLPGRPPPGDTSGHPPPKTAELFYHFAVVNYWYYRLNGVHQLVQTQWHEWLDRCYRDPAAWQQHTENLDLLVDVLKHKGIPFFVVVIPFIETIDVEEPYATWHRKLAGYFNSRQIPFFDFRGRLKGEDPRALTVNLFDVHANENLHDRIANWLLEIQPWSEALENSTND